MTTDRSGTNADSLLGADLDPDVRQFVRSMAEAWAAHPELATATPPHARRIADEVRAPWTEGGPVMGSTAEHHLATAAGEVRVRIYRPDGELPLPAFIYLHGGGWTLFSLDTHDRLMREYAARASMTVVGVDYALSPEAKYPTALDQVCAVVEHLHEIADTQGIDRDRLAIGGDSAGANLAIAACLRLRDASSGALPRAMVLNYGVFDRHSSTEAERRFGGEGYMLSADEMEQFWHNYLRTEADADDPLVCPVKADLAGLPPALLVVPECDLLAEQSRSLADRLRVARVSTQLAFYPGASHSFLEAVSIAGVAESALADSAEWLSQRWTASDS